jgi:hypothetical protein
LAVYLVGNVEANIICILGECGDPWVYYTKERAGNEGNSKAISKTRYLEVLTCLSLVCNANNENRHNSTITEDKCREATKQKDI